jgi:uncharacterized C2H2 Zn-finger protein
MPRDRDRDDRSRRINSPPIAIDRYIPGQDSGEPTGTIQNPIKDPAKLPCQVGYSYYAAWWKANEGLELEKERRRTGRRPQRPPLTPQEEKAKIQAAYDNYKVDLQARMARDFVTDHKREQWFRERYVPETRDPLRQQLCEFRRGLYSQWEQDLESGVFDDFSLEGIPKGDISSSGGMVEKEEGEATATNEILGVGDLVPAPGADIRDDSLLQPTLLIKTIAPHVSRQNLEAFCREHLGEDEGGFKWLSLSDPNPSKRFHRIGWVMLHPSSDPSSDVKSDDIAAPIKLSTAEKALDAVNGKTVKDAVRGDFVCHVGVHNPPQNPRKKALWDLFSASERIERDLTLAQRIVDKFEDEYGADFNANLKISERVEDLRAEGRLQPAVPATPRVPSSIKREHDVDLDAVMEEDEENSGDEDEGAVDDDEVDDEGLLVQKKRLDLSTEYLRRVFSFCFFCVFESDSVHELTRKCPGGHLRRPRSTLSSAAKAVALASANGEPFPTKPKSEPNEEGEIETPESDRKYRNPLSKSEQQLLRAYNWVKTFEDKIGQILQPEAADLRKLGGRHVEEALHDETAKFVKQEDENKWRCKVPECSKLFKEQHFWRKHVEKRHSEWLDSLRQDFELINAYALDPSHIAPSRTDANSNGHFPQGNGQAPTGTPRGFNIQSMTANGILPSMQSGMWAGGGFPPLLSAQPVPGAWGRDDAVGAGGPVRRGGGAMGAGGRFNPNYRSGPYDRRPNPRYEGGGSRPRPGAGTPGGGGRWGDGMAGGAMGPKEAVQGRSLKSYEDLDAAGNAGGELNY